MIAGRQFAAGTAHLGTPGRHHNGGTGNRLDPRCNTVFRRYWDRGPVTGALSMSLLSDGHECLAGLRVKEAVDSAAIHSLSG